MVTQITHVLRKVDDSQILKKEGTTLPYSGPNLTTMLSGVTDAVFVLQRVDANGNSYPYTSQARDQTELLETLKHPGLCCYQTQIGPLSPSSR
jgi:hypothetical protein